MILSLIIFGLITFTNPVIGINCPDPTLLDDREQGGIFKEGCGVAVSDSPEGPFKGPDGQSMKRMKYRYTALKADGVTFAGPGHHSGIVTDEAGQDWLLYHCYDARNGWNGRLLFLGRVDWDEDGWPVISRGGPVAESEAPCFGGNATLTGINKEVE